MLFSLVACALPSANSGVAPAHPVETILREYHSWAPLFQEPRNVSFFLMALCRTQTADEASYQASQHAQYLVQLYVNPTGAAAMQQQGTRVFPDGSVIVKEKWSHDDRFAKIAGATEPAGLGIMFKQNNDWQYAYVDEKGSITRDQKQLDNCRACHQANQARDSVFYPAVLNEFAK